MPGERLTANKIPQLIKALGDPDPAKRSEAADKLGRWSVSEALAPLLPLLSDQNVQVRLSATSSVVVIADRFWEIPEGYHKGADNDEIVAIHKLIKERVLPKLFELLSDPFIEVRLWALRGIMDMTSGVDIIPQLITFLSDPEINIRHAAIASFGRLNTTEDIPYLIQFLSDPDPTLKEAAINALSLKKAQEAIPYLLPLLSDNNGEIRSAAFSAVKRLKVEELIPYLPEWLFDPDKDFRINAILLIEELEVRETIPQLHSLLVDPDEIIRHLAASALGTFGDLQPLITFTNDQDYLTRYYAVTALGGLGNLETLPLLEEIRQRDMDRDDGYSVTIEAAEAIRKIKKRLKVK